MWLPQRGTDLVTIRHDLLCGGGMVGGYIVGENVVAGLVTS